MTLSGKRIAVGVGGGIAAFKSVALVRELQRRGATVRVAMTPSATRFVAPLSFAGLTGTSPLVDLWDPTYPGEMHVELADWAEGVVVAPATANLLARAAMGMADDAVLALLSCATGRPIVLAPAMHERMWSAPATARNVRRLEQDGAIMVGPVSGPLASGQLGMGRMAEPEVIAERVQGMFGARDLAGRTVLITAGPTVEDLDPVRFISNRSSGRMGFALAAAAHARGARVILVAGPTSVAPPLGPELVEVRSALEMEAAVRREWDAADVAILTAAVADYRPAKIEDRKIKKSSADKLTIELVKNPDILAGLGAQRTGDKPVLVGFAMETHDLLASARRKLVEKRCDLIVANVAAVGFGGDDNQATLVDAKGDEALPPMSKRQLAERILDRVAARL